MTSSAQVHHLAPLTPTKTMTQTLRILEDITDELGDIERWLRQGDWRRWPGQCWWAVERDDIQPEDTFFILGEDERGNSALLAKGRVVEASQAWRGRLPLPGCYGQDPWGYWSLAQPPLWTIAIVVEELLPKNRALPISQLYQRHQLSPSFWAYAQGSQALSEHDSALLVKIWQEHRQSQLNLLT